MFAVLAAIGGLVAALCALVMLIVASVVFCVCLRKVPSEYPAPEQQPVTNPPAASSTAAVYVNQAAGQSQERSFLMMLLKAR